MTYIFAESSIFHDFVGDFQMRPPLFYLSVIFILTTLICLDLYSNHLDILNENYKFVVNLLNSKVKSKDRSEDTCDHPVINVFDPEIMKYYQEISKCTPTRKVITKLENRRIIELEPQNYVCWARCLHFADYTHNREDPWIQPKNALFNCDVVETRCFWKYGNINSKPGNMQAWKWKLMKEWRRRIIATKNKNMARRWKKKFGIRFNTQLIYYFIHTQIVEQKIENPKIPVKGKQYSVHIILVDTTSHTQSIRNFPNLREYLLKEQGAVEFPYLNIYFDRSRENMVAISFGKLQHFIDRGDNKTNLVPEPKWEVLTNCKRNLDDEKRLIKEFEEHGYVTNQNDDWLATLNYDCVGNTRLQSHHVYIPYVTAYDKDWNLRKSLVDEHCLERHQPALDYESQFIRAYKCIPKFSWTWMSHIGHDSVWLSKKAEPDLMKLFKENKEELDNSFVFFMGDHGLRHGESVLTRLGEYERKNPMLYVTVPSELRKDERLMKIMKQNSKELQTHFDVRATMLDILKFQPGDNFTSRNTFKIPDELGNSFLRTQPLPRTCRTLPIVPHFCICDGALHQDLTNKDNNTGSEIGDHFVETINLKLNTMGVTGKCGKWKLHKVKRLILRDHKPTRQFEVDTTLENEVSGRIALFKVYANENAEGFSIKHDDRLDTFGSRGDCVDSPALKKICDCAGNNQKTTSA